MQKLLAILFLFSSATQVFAQEDLSLRVKKISALTVYPDSMYFQSRVSRTFIIRDIPQGCKLKVEFTGGDLAMHDSVITLIPFSVYRESEAAKYKSQNISGYKMTKEDFFVADVTISALNARGDVSARVTRKCYIRPQAFAKKKQMTADEYDRQLYQNLNPGVRK